MRKAINKMIKIPPNVRIVPIIVPIINGFLLIGVVSFSLSCCKAAICDFKLLSAPCREQLRTYFADIMLAYTKQVHPGT